MFKFEDFVIKHKKIVDLICNHLSINSKSLSNYDPNLSKQKIGRYKIALSKKEIYDIEKNLSEYIY